ncbi:hypothetical protein NE237_021494 [Protea cynaroides]|uniref:Uncharacterized protein n=1 Tax=Protea cynaroides TaxID=273540 RepID=A0A9Q0HDE5_9MAGN|nr:hypothetical protein NE237_021494 [Protea cynaroides]
MVKFSVDEGDSIFESIGWLAPWRSRPDYPWTSACGGLVKLGGHLAMLLADSTSGDICRRLEMANFKLLPADTKYWELKDKAKGAEGELTREQQKLQKAEGELCQAEEKLCKVKSDLKSAEERVQSVTSNTNKARESLQWLREREKLYREEVIMEYHRSEGYKQALKDIASGYFREGALYLRSYLDNQGVVAYYSVYLSFVEEAEDLGGPSVEELEGGVRDDHSLDLSMFGAPP